jgi:tetraprenyl-beta-curcumene synthase
MADANAPSLRAVLRTLRTEILPVVGAELAANHAAAAALREPRARTVALNSLGAKRFHCEGGAAVALAAPPGSRAAVVRAIVAVQSLSDFLDSWTDRPAPGQAPTAARILQCHQSFVRAATGLGGGSSASERQALGAAAAGYADALAAKARRALGALPSLDRVRPLLLRLSLAYAAMQAMKHAEPSGRAEALRAWHRRRLGGGAGAALSWPEFGAAAGSTLALFRLYAWAAEARPSDRAPAVERAYRPELCALHILLDALVDAAEDRASGDLNWISHLGGERAATERLVLLAARARSRLGREPVGRLLVDGLFATYLADPKARVLSGRTRLRLWRTAGGRALLISLVVRLWGRQGVLGPRPAQLLAERPARSGRPLPPARV